MHGSFIGKLDLEIANGNIIDYKHELITVDPSIEKDKNIDNLINEIYEPYNEYLDEVVGESKSLLFRGLSSSSTMDNFLLKSISYVTGNKVCFSHGWRYGTPIVPGSITIKDLYNIVPMNPKIINVQMKGYEILQLIENKLNKTYNINPFGQTGGFIQRMLGIKAYIMIENPNGHRVQKLYIEGEEYESDRIYNVSYITEQAVPKFLGTNHKELEITAVEAMIKFLKDNGPIAEKSVDNFIII